MIALALGVVMYLAVGGLAVTPWRGRYWAPHSTHTEFEAGAIALVVALIWPAFLLADVVIRVVTALGKATMRGAADD